MFNLKFLIKSGFTVFSLQVGKISLYNAKSNKIILIPVPEYPLEKKLDEETSTLDASLYKEDGILEVCSSSSYFIQLIQTWILLFLLGRN